MHLHPLYDKILVARDAAQGVSEAGVIIPESAKEPPNIGTVVAAGEGRLCLSIHDGRGGVHVEPLRVKVGDRVLFQSYAGTEIQDKESGAQLLLMSEDDVLGILSQTNASAPALRLTTEKIAA